MTLTNEMVRYLIDTAGMSQKCLASAINITPSNISRIYSGERKFINSNSMPALCALHDAHKRKNAK